MVLSLDLHKKSQAYFSAKEQAQPDDISDAPAAPNGQHRPRASCTFVHWPVLVLGEHECMTDDLYSEHG